MKKITHEEYVARLEINNPIVKVIELYINANTPILHHCEIHNIDWNITPHRALQGNGCKEGCPICCESHGEKIIGNYLKKQ